MNSIFGIGVLEFIFILIFALIFLGPERLPKVTKDVLFFIRRLQRLSGDLTRQVNEEIGDLRELDPSYHMKQLMDDEEEEEEEEKSIGQGDGQKSTAGTKQTSAPSQPAQAAAAAAASSDEETPEQKSPAQPALSDLNAAASTNGRQQSGGNSDGNVKTTGTAIPSAPKASSAKVTTRNPNPAIGATPKRTGSTQKRGVKTLSDLRKQQRAKRQTNSSGADSSYLDERNKRAQRRAESRRQAVAAQKDERQEASELDDAAPASADTGAGDESVAAAGMGGNGEGAAKGGTDTEVLDKEGGGESLEGAVAALAEDAEGDGNEETQL